MVLEINSLEDAVGIATIASSAATTLILYLMVRTLDFQHRSGDADTLFRLIAQIRESEAELIQADSDEKKEAALNNHLNFLDSVATAVNNKLFGRTTRRIAQYRLINDIRILRQIKGNDFLKTARKDLISSEKTFAELEEFMRLNARRLAQPVRVEILDEGLGSPPALWMR